MTKPDLTDEQWAAMRDMVAALAEAEQEMVPAELRAAGWVYRDLPGWLSDEHWQKFLSVMGHDNYKLIIMSHRNGLNRGQFFLSPAALANLQAWRVAA